MERGRKAVRGAFVAVWRKATDITAIDEACKNFAPGLIDDPDLLDAAVDAAAKRGDSASATALATRLDRALRLRPLLADLTGAAPQRSRAKQQLAGLPAADDRPQRTILFVDTLHQFVHDGHPGRAH